MNYAQARRLAIENDHFPVAAFVEYRSTGISSGPETPSAEIGNNITESWGTFIVAS